MTIFVYGSSSCKLVKTFLESNVLIVNKSLKKSPSSGTRKMAQWVKALAL